MKKKVAVGVALSAVLAVGLPWLAMTASTEVTPQLLHQLREGGPAVTLPAAERALLGDPMFNLVLRDHPDAVTLSAIDSLLQPSVGERVTFVVHEEIAHAARNRGHRRAALAYRGRNGAEVLEPNVMLSLFFSSEELPDIVEGLEAWGWDEHRGRYNYYKLDRSGTPDGRLTWKFRGSSQDADLLSVEERKGTCMSCHINGAPLMKELAFPWNNWHSPVSRAGYLEDSGFSPDRWPVTRSLILRGKRLQGAEQLEGMIAGAINQFNTRRINAALERRSGDGNVAVDARGMARVIEGRRLLKHLFVTTEYNIISAQAKSGAHPFGSGQQGEPGADVVIPGSFFVNTSLLAGNGPLGLRGLNLEEARAFNKLAEVKPAEYRRLITEARVRLGGKAGDADFAWFVPEAGHVDNSMVDALLQRGVVTPQFVAAVMAVDLEDPVLSAGREALLAFMPDTFGFTPSGEQGTTASGHPDELTRIVIARLRAAAPAKGTPAADLLRRLESPDPVALLRNDLKAYHARVAARLADAGTRQTELTRLYGLAIDRRERVIHHAVLHTLDETGGKLFPMP